LDDLVASERRNISDVIFRRIRDAIISGELPPGYVFLSFHILFNFQMEVNASSEKI